MCGGNCTWGFSEMWLETANGMHTFVDQMGVMKATKVNDFVQETLQ